MTAIQLEIQGNGAIAASQALFEEPGISGHWETAAGETEKETVVATIATIVGIVGGSIAIAEQIRKWYQEYRQKNSERAIEYVLIVRGDKRLFLKDITLDEGTVRQIQDLLE